MPIPGRAQDLRLRGAADAAEFVGQLHRAEPHAVLVPRRRRLDPHPLAGDGTFAVHDEVGVGKRQARWPLAEGADSEAEVGRRDRARHRRRRDAGDDRQHQPEPRHAPLELTRRTRLDPRSPEGEPRIVVTDVRATEVAGTIRRRGRRPLRVGRELDLERADAEQRAARDLDVAGQHPAFDDLEPLAAADDARLDGERLAQQRTHEVGAEADRDDIVAACFLQRVHAERAERAAVHQVVAPRSRRRVRRDEAGTVHLEERLRAQ